MNTAKFVLNLVKTDHKFQWMLAAIFFMFVGLFVVFFGKSIGLETDTKNLIASGLSGIGCLIFFLVSEKSKYLFICGFLSAVFLISICKLLELKLVVNIFSDRKL